MKYVKSSIDYKGIKIILTWILDKNFEKYKPITQVYGVVFNNKGDILIARETSESKWQIPGGKPEKGESIEETIRRELLEEVDVKAGKIFPLGVQKIEMPGNPNKIEGDIFYQLRCVVELGESLPQTLDPDKGSVWERMFVPAEKVIDYVQWGKSGEAMFKDAIRFWQKRELFS